MFPALYGAELFWVNVFFFPLLASYFSHTQYIYIYTQQKKRKKKKIEMGVVWANNPVPFLFFFLFCIISQLLIRRE
jgi:hypothetical protein